MASDFKPYPPSDAKLLKLRREGIYPRSRAVTVFASVLGAAVGMFLVFSSGATLVSRLGGLWRGDPEAGARPLETAREVILSGGWLFLMPLLALVLFFGLLQSRFLFAPGLIRFTFGRLLPRPDRLASEAKRSIGTALMFLFWSGAMYVLLRTGLESLAVGQAEPAEPFSSFRSSSALGANGLSESALSFLEISRENVLTTCFTALGFAFAAALLSRFTTVVGFRSEHGMSREEIEAENRETEISPDIRRRISEMREEQ